MGRPTNSLKSLQVTARLDTETSFILNTYCKQEKISDSEGVRRGIKRLKNDLK
jgi:hypothetical protein